MPTSFALCRKQACILLFAVLSCTIFLRPVLGEAVLKSNHRTVDLNSGWEFRQFDGSQGTPAAWQPAQVPGDIHLDLLRNKLIPDPFYRQNESALQWIQEAGWQYTTTFSADADLLQHTNIDLVFDGLDAAADVYLNGHKVLSADNMFRQWRIDAKAYLSPGENRILVFFPSAVKAAAAAAAGDAWRKHTLTAEKTYVRKAAYEYGWDWGPTLVTSGIWKPVRVEAWNSARISNLYIHQLDVSADIAHLTAMVEVIADAPGSGKIELQMGVPGGTTLRLERDVHLSGGVNLLEFPIDVAKPRLWFPAGYGEHPVYSFHVALSSGGLQLDEAATHAGLRSVELRRTVDQWGRSFEMVVNGIPVFAKGADVIPFDSFPNRVTTAQYRRVLQSAVDANMNMVRSWGGGYYESDEFFDICDELGLMVWQDFMFGNEWQPGTYAFKENVEQEVEYQVRRLRNHPSIVLWCGNNETEISWTWDRTKEPLDHAGPDGRRQMWQDYLTLFSGIIPRTVARLNPATPYWPSSPSADYEEVSDSYQSGDIHDWSVWHGRAPFSEYEAKFPRFVSEYGFQSFPEMKTIDKFTEPQDRGSIFTPVMLAHQKNEEGNAIIDEYMRRYYGEPKDFASFLYASQVLQAEGVKVEAEHLRRNRPRSMGSLYWQLNDCWPVASWSSIDYYGRWKALQYYARRFYSPVLASAHIEDGNLAVYVVDDETTTRTLTLNMRVMTLEGKLIEEKHQDISLQPLASKAYMSLPIEQVQKSTDLHNVFAVVTLADGKREVSRNITYFVPTEQVGLPHAPVASELTSATDGYRLRLTSTVLARSVYVSFGKLETEVSDNYVDLLPNEPVDIVVHSGTGLTELRAAMTVYSLAAAFSPNSMKASSSSVPANPDWK